MAAHLSWKYHTLCTDSKSSSSVLHSSFCVTVFHRTEHLIMYLFPVLQNNEIRHRSWLIIILFHTWACCQLHIWCKSCLWLEVTFSFKGSWISHFMQDFFIYNVWQMTSLNSEASLYYFLCWTSVIFRVFPSYSCKWIPALFPTSEAFPEVILLQVLQCWKEEKVTVSQTGAEYFYS
jgi:hypothetical protein